MDLYITEKATGTKVALSLLPDEIKTKGSVNFISYNFISVGEVKMPGGLKAQTFSWNGVFPGEAMKRLPFVKKQHWKAPKEMVSVINKWKENKTRLVLMLTETPINYEVYVSSFESDYSGGLGDIAYSISFVEARETTITAIPAPVSNTSSSSKSNTTTTSRPASSKTASTTRTYTVKWGDCPWTLAEKYYGDGTKWPKIIDANQWLKDRNNKLGVVYYMLYVGDELTIP